MKLRMMSCLLGAAWLSTGCAGADGENVATLEEELRLLEKPGTSAAAFTEAGQDIERRGPYTFYSANSDSNTAGTFQGSVQLFKNSAPLRSYQARTNHPGGRMGFFVGMSDHWLSTNVKFFPSAPGVTDDVVMLVGKDASGEFASCGSIAPNGDLPNCVTCVVAPDSGSGLPDFLRTTCTPKPGVQMIRPAAFTSGESVNEVELAGNELFVPSSQKIALLAHNGSSWVESAPLLPPSGETFTGRVSVSGNRLAASASGLSAAGHVLVYSRASATSAWQLAARVHSPNPSGSQFGAKLDLGGNSLVVTDSSNTYFFDLVAGTPSSPDAGVVSACTLPTASYDVAISGSNVVVANAAGMPKTYLRGDGWRFQGGLPSGLFPRDLTPSGGPTTFSMWGAAASGDEAAIGWRNYRGANPATETGAALEFSIDEYDCGSLRSLPGGGSVRAGDLSATGVTVPQWSFPQFPPTNAIDGNAGTRWMGPSSPGSKIEFQLAELQMFSHLEIDWGTTYSHNYTIEVSENGTTWFTVAQVTNGTGGLEVVNLSTNAQAFGKAIRITMNGFKTQPGTGDWGVAIREFKAFRRVHDECNVEIALSCTGARPAHACENFCGGFATGLSCYCDSACANFGDCCSFDGANHGAEYQSGVDAVCGFGD